MRVGRASRWVPPSGWVRRGGRACRGAAGGLLGRQLGALDWRVFEGRSWWRDEANGCIVEPPHSFCWPAGGMFWIWRRESVRTVGERLIQEARAHGQRPAQTMAQMEDGAGTEQGAGVPVATSAQFFRLLETFEQVAARRLGEAPPHAAPLWGGRGQPVSSSCVPSMLGGCIVQPSRASTTLPSFCCRCVQE